MQKLIVSHVKLAEQELSGNLNDLRVCDAGKRQGHQVTSLVDMIFPILIIVLGF